MGSYIKRGRRRGEAHHQKRLTQRQVDQIRERYDRPCATCGRIVTQRELAREFGVSNVMIHKIVKNESWKV